MRRFFFLVTLLCVALSPIVWAEWNVRAFGALGDGVQDDTGAFQQALDTAGAAKGGVVAVDAGTYRINGGLRIPAGVTLQGTFHTPPTCNFGEPVPTVGSILHAYGGRGAREGEPLIRMAGHASVFAGFIVFYPEWKQADVPPVPYPPAVSAEGVEDVCVADCCIVNPTEALYFKNAHRMIVRNVFGYPSVRGLYIDACYDIGRVENCHFWPFGVAYNADDPFCEWVNVNGVAYEFSRTDWQYVTHTFCFGYGVGYKFSKSEAGACNGSFVGIGADSCRRPVLVEDCQEPGLLITNGEFVGRWSSKDSVGVEIVEGSGLGKVSLTNCSFWGPLDTCIVSSSTETQLTVTATNFCHWDNALSGSPAVALNAGRAILQGNTFGQGDTHVVIGKDVASAIVMGNQAVGGLTCDNQAGDRAQFVANEISPVTWPEGSKRHYRIAIGADGDRPYVKQWFGGEDGGMFAVQGASMRWSQPESFLRLPVEPGAVAHVTLDLHLPEHAIAAANGIFLGEEKVGTLPETPGRIQVTLDLPAQEKSSVTLRLRVKGWQPSQISPLSDDTRTLGIAARSVEVRVECAEDRWYNANTGAWGE